MRWKRRQPGIKFLPADIHTIQKALLTNMDIQWYHPDAVPGNGFSREITGAISYNSDGHEISQHQNDAKDHLDGKADPVGLVK